MKVKFIGAIGRVTGSCTWLKDEKTNTEFLVDCGMVQGEVHDGFLNSQPFPFDPSKLKFVLLTHAHLDHCGLIPRLYKEGFAGRVICTEATARLAREIQLDAVKIGAPYEYEDVNKVSYVNWDKTEKFKWGFTIPIENDLFIYFLRNAHILGSVSIGIVWGGKDSKTILFTGDIGKNKEDFSWQPMLKHRQSPFPQTNYIVLEATYGNRVINEEDNKYENRIAKLENTIVDTIYKRKGRLIIPTFSLNRTQEILFDLIYIFRKKWKDKIPFNEKMEMDDFFKDSIHSDKFRCSIIENNELEEEDKAFVINCYKMFLTGINQTIYKEIMEKNPSKDLTILKKSLNYMKKSYRLQEDISEKNLEMIRSILIEVGQEDKIKYCLKELNYSDKAKLSKILEKINMYSLVKVFLDSPLSNRISKIYAREINYKRTYGLENKYIHRNSMVSELFDVEEENIDKILKELFENDSISSSNYIVQYRDPSRKKPNLPSIVLTSSGMCDHGPVVSNLEEYLTDEKNTILLTGYQCRNTNGYILSNLKDSEKIAMKEISLPNNKKLNFEEIKAEIVELKGPYSGHADQSSLIEYITPKEDDLPKYVNRTIFLNHGDNLSRKELAEKIKENDIKISEMFNNPVDTKVLIPSESDGWYDLDINGWEENEKEVNKISDDNSIETLTLSIERLTDAINKLSEIIVRAGDKQ